MMPVAGPGLQNAPGVDFVIAANLDGPGQMDEFAKTYYPNHENI
jgi:hypothetical protein